LPSFLEASSLADCEPVEVETDVEFHFDPATGQASPVIEHADEL
jgi:hypothetical protein